MSMSSITSDVVFVVGVFHKFSIPIANNILKSQGETKTMGVNEESEKTHNLKCDMICECNVVSW